MLLLDFMLGTQAEYTVTYQMFDHRVAQRLWERQLMSGERHQYVSRTQFYNWGETEQEVRDKLMHSLEKIQQLAPEHNIQHSLDLNTLHTLFPDLVHHATGELRHWLSMFNYHLHHLEDITRYQNKRFITSTNTDNTPEPLLLTDYELFTTSRHYGYLYMNYPHVGKHIAEIAFDNDVDIPAHHIVPTSQIKNDFYAWFDADSEHDPVRLKKRIQRWCMQIAHKLPYSPDDVRLAIGYIPVGKLHQPVDLDQIARHRYIHSVLARVG